MINISCDLVDIFRRNNDSVFKFDEKRIILMINKKGTVNCKIRAQALIKILGVLTEKNISARSPTIGNIFGSCKNFAVYGI